MLLYQIYAKQCNKRDFLDFFKTWAVQAAISNLSAWAHPFGKDDHKSTPMKKRCTTLPQRECRAFKTPCKGRNTAVPNLQEYLF